MQIYRDVFDDIISRLNTGKILILKGARQVGKTTIMKAIQSRFAEQGEQTFYIAADEDFDGSIFKTPQHFMARLQSEVPSPDDFVYVFVDEFQYIRNPGRFVKVLHDKHTPRLRFLVSGSSSLEITKNTEFLTGRKIEFTIQRVSFREFARFAKPGIENAFTQAPFDFDRWKLLYEVHAPDLEILFSRYAQFGGYPEIITTQDYEMKKTLLRELVSSYIQKDIIAFLKVGNVAAFNNLLKVLCADTAGLLNRQSLAGTLGIAINTLNKYLDILEGTHVCRFLPPFFENIRKEVSKMRKIFICDSGLRHFILNRFPSDYGDISGQAAENLAFLALKHCVPDERLFYYRTIGKAEIDFVIDNGDIKDAIEVKFRKKPASVPVAMRNFSERYRTRRQIIVTKDTFEYKDDALFIPLPLFEFYMGVS